MRLVLATNSLGLGGSESYLVTVAEQLDRLGHEVVIYTSEAGAGATVAGSLGIEVVTDLDPAARYDAALTQDAATSHDLAARLPEVPQLFVAHSETFDLQVPPQLDRQVELVVALNDRVARKLGSLVVETEIVRLRQPIDIERMTLPAPLPAVARRAVLYTNNSIASRQALIEGACADAGLELVRLGGEGQTTGDPRSELARAQIMIGYGRSILEAMSAGRAAYVYDQYGGDGWVTAQTYPALEADGFAGRGEGAIDAARLSADLAAYSAAMGPVNRDLAVAHHRANVHAQELAALLRRLAPVQRAREPHEEMARLVRLEWRSRVEAQALRREQTRLQEELLASASETEQAFAHADQLRRNYESTVGWRATKLLRAARDRLRRFSRG